MKRATAINRLIFLTGLKPTQLLLDYIDQYPDRCKPDKAGYFQPNHSKVRRRLGVDLETYRGLLQDLCSKHFLTEGRHAGQGTHYRIEFKVLDEVLRWAWVPMLLRRVRRWWQRVRAGRH